MYLERLTKSDSYAVQGKVDNFGDSPLMGKDDYRHNAAEILELANKATTFADKGRLVRLAERWLELADRAPRRSSQRLGDHPLVKKTLGDDQQEME